MKIPERLILLLALPALLLGTSVWAGEAEDQARAVFEEYKQAVVTVRLVVKDTSARRERETKAEVVGTVISPDGLTVLSLSSTDPNSLFLRLLGGSAGPGPGQDTDTQVSDVEFLLHDGTEADGQIVLRDNDLDLAFARPIKKPDKPMVHVELDAAAVPRILDEVVVLTRLGKIANRAPAVGFSRIESVIEKPRTFYVPKKEVTDPNLGAPALTLEGEIIGVFVARVGMLTGGMSGSFSMIMDGLQNMMPILLPAADILESAQQAPPFEEEAEK